MPVLAKPPAPPVYEELTDPPPEPSPRFSPQLPPRAYAKPYKEPQPAPPRPIDSARLAASGQLRVHLKKGVGLRAADLSGKSDPYVKVRAGTQAEKKSKVIKRTLNPEWNEILSFTGTLQEFVSSPLMLRAYDWDSKLKMGNDDLLGDVSVSLDALKYDDAHDFAVALSTQGSVVFTISWEPTAKPSHKQQFNKALDKLPPPTVLPPPTRLHVPPVPAFEQLEWPDAAQPLAPPRPVDSVRLAASGQLRVHLKKGVGLRAADLSGKSDPYVKVRAGTQAEKKSKVIKRTLNPEWNEILSFTGTLQEFVSSPLMLRAYDWDSKLKMGNDDLLGDVSVSLDALKYDDAHDFAVALSTQGSVVFTVSWEPTLSSRGFLSARMRVQKRVEYL